MPKTAKRAALYVRVSTDHQSVDNQIQELGQIAERRGWIVVATYRDAGISGAEGRDKRPGLDAMLKDAGRRKFDICPDTGPSDSVAWYAVKAGTPRQAPSLNERGVGSRTALACDTTTY